MKLQIAATRAERPYGNAEYFGRILWAFFRWLFHCSPRVCFGWRVFLLRRFGAQIGRGVHIYPGARIELPWQLEVGDLSSIADGVRVYNLGTVRIGARSTVSYGAHLCAGTHDHEDARFPLQRLPIHIGDDVWICADAFLGPGVSVGDGAVVAARSVVVEDVPPWVVVAGHPSRVIKPRVIRPA